MEHSPLITTLVAAIVLAFVFGFLAQRLRLSPIVGYLLAGVAVGPYTPGVEADVGLALQLSEIGVILLMFGVGLKISIEDIWSVRWVSIPGSLLQTVLVALIGAAVGIIFGQPVGEALLFGSAISVASTVVFFRVLEDRRLMKTEQGRLGVSWLLVEDLLIVIAIVILPALVSASAGDGTQVSPLRTIAALGLTFAKIAVFVVVMLVIGARFFPWLIVKIAHTKSRELLSLGTLALALGVAWIAYAFFDASFALGAFLGGLALNGSRFSHRVAEDSLPLRDTFAVLFFVAVGMLFDPASVMDQPLALAAIVFVVVGVKAALAYWPLRMMKQSHGVSALVALGTAQIGEFSFVLANMGRDLEVMSVATYNLILAASLVSIAVNPFLLRLVPHTGSKPGADVSPA